MIEDDEFNRRNQEDIAALRNDEAFRRRSLEWLLDSADRRYSYHFRWLGVPIIQYPTDIVATQEIIWETKPDLILETGVARGGSLILYASLLRLLGGARHVVGIDIEIRQNNRANIESHPMSESISLIEGSSIDPATVRKAREIAGQYRNPMVVLDSNHTHEHVLAELKAYSPLVRKGGYLVVFDTIIDDMPAGSFPDRPWNENDNPKTAVREFLKGSSRFVIDHDIDAKLGVTVGPSGYLRCIAD